MPTGDNSQSRLTQRRRDVTLANYRIYNPTSPLQTPTMGGVTPVSVYVNSEKGVLPWVYETPGGVVSEPNPVALPPVAAGPSGTVPGAPTLTSATPGNQRITLVWTAPSSIGSSPITDYLYTTDTGATKTYRSLATTGTTATITTNSAGTALANGTSYTISIVAVNAAGPSVASGPLNATPIDQMVLAISITTGSRTIRPSIGFTAGQSVTINWGDNTTPDSWSSGQVTHTYATIGTYTLTITGTANSFNGINTPVSNTPAVILSVSSFLSSLTNLSNMFKIQTGNFTVPNSIPAGVTNMSQMFAFATAFNQDISSWNTAAVTNMSQMFSGATAFNRPLATSGNSWNTAAVTNMSAMFQSATAFNQDISSWNTAAVTNMSAMFNVASAFNQPLATNGNSWNTAAVTNMQSMFANTIAFNQDISSWNTAAVTNMQNMFNAASAFNQDISSWNTAAMTDMSQMFAFATAFNQDISSWNTAAVTNMSQMFNGASAFNQPLATNGNSWNTAKVTNMFAMFYNARAFNQDIRSWNTAAVTNMGIMFNGASAFNQQISSWNISSLTLNGAKSIFANCPEMIANSANWPPFASNPPGLTNDSTWYTT